MKIRIKLDLYVSKEYFIVTLCEKKSARVYPNLVKWWLKCGRGRSPNSQINIGYDHLQHKGLPGIVSAKNG